MRRAQENAGQTSDVTPFSWLVNRTQREPTSCGRPMNVRFTPLILGSWNVRTLQDKDNAPRPERRTALVCNELSRFNVDIAALSETRFANEGMLEEKGSGYTIFWSGKDENEKRIHGVGLALKTKLVKQHNLMPKAINERLMTVRIPLHFNTFLTVISAYAPTLDTANDIKENFYAELHSIISSIDHKEKLIILGDFNARVGKDHDIWNGVLGKHGIGNCNDNGILLLSLCAEFQLTITNSLFQLPTRQKTKIQTLAYP